MTAVTYQKLVAQNLCENLDVLWKTSIMFGSCMVRNDAVRTSG